MRYSLFLLFFLLFANFVKSQKQRPLTRVLIVFDASNSMYNEYKGSTRIETAKKMFEEFVDTLTQIPNAEFALRFYGHQKKVPPQDCSDTRLEIPFAKNNLSEIRSRIKNLTPKGTTPIARSLIEAADDFPNTPGVNMIILITDGIEECGGDVCEAAKKLKEKGIQFRPFIIGIALSAAEAKTFDCVGDFYDISSPGIFSEIVDVIITQTLHVTTAQVNLLDISGKPTETNVNMTFYDKYSGAVLYNYMHTMNIKGNPDTVKVDPSNHYRIVINTIPPVVKDSVVLYPGKHNIIAFETPQGKLQLKSSAGIVNLTNCIVRKNDEKQTLHVQELNSTEKYIAGSYDLEILTLPRIYHHDVLISPNSTKTIDVPSAGTIKLSAKETGYGSIFAEDKGKLNWIYDLNEANPSEILNLQPGNYRIVFRPKSRKETIYTIEKKFTIISGAAVNLNLF
jgi:Ca-activated chloride channel homolog